MKKSTKIIAGIVILAALAAAFWFGGSAPGTQGWKSGGPEQETAADPAETPQEEPVSPDGSGQTAAAAEEESVPAEEPEEPSGPAEEPAETPAGEQEQGTAAEPAETPGEDLSPATGPETMEVDPATGKDQYQTAPVPDGKPAPVEPQDVTVTDVPHNCTISIECGTILDHMDWLDPEKAELVPADGGMCAPVTVTFYEGESVFNVLQRSCRQNGIHMEFENTPMYNSAYIEAIQNLYEFDCGELSGWMYSVNGWFPNYGCSRYAVQPGDVIRWVFTCDLGYDVGGGYASGN